MPPVLTKENEDRLLTMLRDICGPMVGEVVQQNMATFREQQESFLQGKLLVNEPKDEALYVKSPVTGRQRRVRRYEELAKGEAIGRAMMAVAYAKGDPGKASQYYRTMYGSDDDPIAKALAATDATAGGFLITDEMANEVIELLRPMSKFRMMNPQIVQMETGNLRVPKITSGASAGYMAENTNTTATEQILGQVQAMARKLGALVPVSNDLIMRSPQSTSLVRDDLIAALAQESDLRFIRGDGTVGRPKGLRYWAASGNLLNVNATVNTENVLYDLGSMVQTLMDGNVRMQRVGWMFAPRTWQTLLTMTSSTGQMVLREEMSNGMLFGFPFQISTQIPTNLAVTDTSESEIYLADFADMVIVEQEGLRLEASDTAAYHDGSNVVAAFSLDQTVTRAIQEHDLICRHDESIAVLIDVDWGVSGGITT